ncbi:MAG: THUMP domain-containing protein [Candidatus Cloacimonadaceae bacterium]|nr:THUMP domain-containing protein [Candidatus Cloacimonadaceae bacterium]
MENYEYQKHHKYFAQVAGSLEKHAAQELGELGAEVLGEVPRGLRFQCDPETLYRVLYTSRLAQRVLAPLISFNCHSEKYLYKLARERIDWTGLFALDQKFAIESNVSASHIKHSLYAGQILKDAICDSFRDKYQARPDFSSSAPDILFNLHIHENFANIYLDLAGISMHKRGYRKAAGDAPLQETLAAALIRLSGWNGEKPLLDPMCGSGTILCEALMHLCKIPAAYLRGVGALRLLPDFDPQLWKKVKDKADAAIIKPEPGMIKGSDIYGINLEIARENLNSLPHGKLVELRESPFQALPGHPNHVIITNPPYGVRIGEIKTIGLLYNELGDFLKQKCPHSEAYVLCGNDALVSELRLRAHWKKSLKNGDITTKFAKIVLR